MPSSIESCKLCANYFAGACGGLSGLGAGLIVYVVNTDKHTLSYYLAFPDCPSGVARPAKQPEFQLVLHQG